MYNRPSKEALITFGEALATQLGGTGSYDPQYECLYDIRLDACTIVCDSRTHTGKMEIFARLPSNKLSGYWHGVKTPKISVSATRDAQAVARDVLRRLVPDAIKATQEAQAQIDRYTADVYVSKTHCTQLGIEPNHGGHIGSRYLDGPEGSYCDVKVQDGGSIIVELRYLPIELAKQVIALVESAARKASAA